MVIIGFICSCYSLLVVMLLVLFLLLVPASSLNCHYELEQGWVRRKCVDQGDVTIYECAESPGSYYGARYGKGGECSFQSVCPRTISHYHMCGCKGVKVRDNCHFLFNPEQSKMYVWD